jgi:sporulation protein YlmC with PRC-barrel domain
MRCEMRMLAIVGVGLLLIGGQTLLAKDPPPTGTDAPQIESAAVFRSSTLVGMTVKNPAGEKLGTVNDLVIDVHQGKIRYAALSFGGILGVGNKLFAIPWTALKLQHDDKDNVFVLNVDKERLKNAPGFDKDHWPDVGNPRFGEEIDRYYGVIEPRAAELPLSAR